MVGGGGGEGRRGAGADLGPRAAAEEVVVARQPKDVDADHVLHEGIVGAGGRRRIEGNIDVGVARERHDDHLEEVDAQRHLVAEGGKRATLGAASRRHPGA